MKVVMTGANGFLGGHLLASLKAASEENGDVEVWPIRTCKADTGASVYNFAREDLIRNDVHRIDVLLHVGAFTPKNREEMNDVSHNISNITNTQYLLQNLPAIPRRVIYISSVSVYTLIKEDIISETTPVLPDSLYGMSKLFSERIVQEYACANAIDCQILRMGVMYGNNIAYNGLIPTVIKRILRNEPIIIQKGGEELKSFIHVKDCCRVIQRALLAAQVKNEIINVVSEKSISVNELINKIIIISGRPVCVERYNDKTQRVNVRYDNTRMVDDFGENETDYDVGLSAAFRWFEAHYRA